MEAMATRQRQDQSSPPIRRPHGSSERQHAQVRTILRGSGIQTKLRAGKPDDQYEKEADRVAMQVVDGLRRDDGNPAKKQSALGLAVKSDISESASLPKQPTPTPRNSNPVQSAASDAQGQGLNTSYKEELRLKPVEEGQEDLPGEDRFHTSQSTGRRLAVEIASIRRGGKPLENRGLYEAHLGYDFGKTRIHADRRANQLATRLGARAFTYTNHIVFGAGQYQPTTIAGQGLLAHELTHVIQQDSSATAIPNLQRKPAAALTQKVPQTEAVKAFAEREEQLLSTYGQFLPANIKQYLLLANLEAGFSAGFLEALKKRVKRSDVEAFSEGFNSPKNQILFEAGMFVGMLIGAGEGIYNNLEGLYQLAKLLWKLSVKIPPEYRAALAGGPFGPAILSTIELYKFAKDPQGRLDLYKRIGNTSKEITLGLWEFVKYLQTNPNALLIEGEKLGLQVGDIAAEWFEGMVLLEPDYYWKGVAVGEIIGLIALEIALLFLGPEEWVIRGVASAGKGVGAAAKTAARALRGSKFANRILEILEKIPGLKRILKILQQTEGIAAKTAAKGSKVTRKATEFAEQVTETGAETTARTSGIINTETTISYGPPGPDLGGPRLRGRLGEVTRFIEVERYPGKFTELFPDASVRRRIYTRIEKGDLSLEEFARILGHDGAEQVYFRTPHGGRYIDHVFPLENWVVLRESKNVTELRAIDSVKNQLKKDKFLLDNHPEAIVHWRISGTGDISDEAWDLLELMKKQTKGRFDFTVQQ